MGLATVPSAGLPSATVRIFGRGAALVRVMDSVLERHEVGVRGALHPLRGALWPSPRPCCRLLLWSALCLTSGLCIDCVHAVAWGKVR